MNDLQQAARTRKLIYLGLIVGLFTLSLFLRGKFALGDAAAAEPTALDRVARLTVEGQASNLELSELDMGDPEIAGSAARVSLVGFRGVVITTLWSSAIEKQRRYEYHDFELYARLVTRLQPNFITPWLFQGWNIAYNVSVENEKLGDMFFFIARGIELMTEGDRLNTKSVRRPGMAVPFITGSPDLRREIGFIYQNKFTVSDKVTTLRCLMALSVMKPDDRLPARLRKQNSPGIDDAQFRAFCVQNPQLVRRLRTPRPNPTLGEKVTDTIAATPVEVADFLAANTELPTRWEKNGQPKPDEAQFPALPPAFAGDSEYHPGHPDLVNSYDRFDALLAARAWFAYGQQVVPPPPRDSAGVPYAAASPRRPSDYDPGDPNAEYKYRLPQRPALIIYRYDPARAQTYLATRLQSEGWYDAESTWNPDENKSGDDRWFPDKPEQLKASRNSLDEWREAAVRWNTYGDDNGLMPSATMQAAMDVAYRKTLAVFPPYASVPDDLTPEAEERGITPDDLRLRKAHDALPQNLQITNFVHFRNESSAESTPEMVKARKQLLAAESKRVAGDIGAATAAYADAIAQWRRALDKTSTQDYHRGTRSDTVHEFTFDLEQKLTTLYKDDPDVLRLGNETLNGFQAAVPIGATENALALTRKDLLQQVASEKAEAEIAVQMRVQVGVPEADARKQVADGGEFAYLKRFTAADTRVSWVRPDVRQAKLTTLGYLRPQAPPSSGEPPTPADGPSPQQMPGPPN